MLRGTGKPPAGAPLGRGRALRGGAKERVGVVVPEPGLDTTFTGCRRARGEGAVGVRNLLLEGTEDERRERKSRLRDRQWKTKTNMQSLNYRRSIKGGGQRNYNEDS